MFINDNCVVLAHDGLSKMKTFLFTILSLTLCTQRFNLIDTFYLCLSGPEAEIPTIPCCLRSCIKTVQFCYLKNFSVTESIQVKVSASSVL